MTLKGSLNIESLLGRNNLPRNRIAVTGILALVIEMASAMEIYLQTIE
jgi:hypothetical protein